MKKFYFLFASSILFLIYVTTFSYAFVGSGGDENSDPPNCGSKDIIKLVLKEMDHNKLPQGQLFDIINIRSDTFYSSICGATLILNDGREAGVSYAAYIDGGKYSIDSLDYEIKNEAFELYLLTASEDYRGYVRDIYEHRMRFAELIDDKGTQVIFIGELSRDLFNDENLKCIETAIETKQPILVTGHPIIWSDGSKVLDTKKPLICSKVDFSSNTPTLGFKEEVLTFLGLENDVNKCVKKGISGKFDCLKYSKGNNLLYLAKSKDVLTEPHIAKKQLVYYETNAQGTFFIASFTIPQNNKPRKLSGIFQGSDGSEEGFSMIDKSGKNNMFTCDKNFCAEMLKYVGKQIEIEFKTIYYYHDESQSYGMSNYIESFSIVSP